MSRVRRFLIVLLFVPPILALTGFVVGFIVSMFTPDGMPAYAIFLGGTVLGAFVSFFGFLFTAVVLVFSRARRQEWLSWIALPVFPVYLVTLQTLAGH